MAKNKNPVWSYERYALALQGHAGIPALRKTVEGFTPADGYDLRQFHNWTSSQKRRVRKYYDDVHLLLSQERRVVFPRNKAAKKKLQHAFHGDVASSKFKAVFVPYTTPILSTGEHLEGRITYTQAGIKIHNGEAVRHFEPFDQYALASDPETEVKRVTNLLKGASLYYIQVNEFQTLNGGDAKIISNKVLKWIAQYDGVKALPKGRHYGERPEAHFYGDWLKGMVGYQIGEADIMSMNKKIIDGIKGAKERRHDQDMSVRAMSEVMKMIGKVKEKWVQEEFKIMLRHAPHDLETLNIFKREIAKVLRRQ